MSAGLIPGNAWEGRQTRKVGLTKFIPHPFSNIALIKLSQPFINVMQNGRHIINTICLPQETENSNEQMETAVMFGLGQTSTGAKFSNDLMKGTLLIQPYTICQTLSDLEEYSSVSPDWSKLLCANTTIPGVTKTCAVREAIISLKY